MAEKSVREDLAVALEMMSAAISPDVYRKAAADLGRMEQAEIAFRYADAALARHRAEPEWRSQCCGKPPHAASDVTADNPVGFCCMCRESTVFEREEPEEHCGCDGPECPTWQAGHQAGTEGRREPAGRGTA